MAVADAASVEAVEADAVASAADAADAGVVEVEAVAVTAAVVVEAVAADAATTGRHFILRDRHKPARRFPSLSNRYGAHICCAQLYRIEITACVS